MSQESPAPVTVQILEKEYRVSCEPEERQGLLESARILDERMREVRKSGRSMAGDRIAVMASLNLIYELMQERDQQATLASRLYHLQERINHAIGADSAASKARETA